MVMMIFKQKTKKNNMKKLIAILMLAVTVTACSWPTTTTETMGEPVDSTLSQDTVGGGSVDTTAVAQ